MAPTSVSLELDGIDWCENNYTVSYYITEFCNTTPSFLIAVVAAAGYIDLASSIGCRTTLLMQIFIHGRSSLGGCWMNYGCFLQRQ